MRLASFHMLTTPLMLQSTFYTMKLLRLIRLPTQGMSRHYRTAKIIEIPCDLHDPGLSILHGNDLGQKLDLDWFQESVINAGLLWCDAYINYLS